MKRCKSPAAGVCSAPITPAGVVLTCEDHYPGGICKAKCKHPGLDVVEAVSFSLSRSLFWRPILYSDNANISKFQFDSDPGRLRDQT